MASCLVLSIMARFIGHGAAFTGDDVGDGVGIGIGIGIGIGFGIDFGITAGNGRGLGVKYSNMSSSSDSLI